MRMLNAMNETIRRAKESQRKLYLYWNSFACCYSITPTWQDDWLFKAYPGGRTELSQRGLKRIDDDYKERKMQTLYRSENHLEIRADSVWIEIVDTFSDVSISIYRYNESEIKGIVRVFQTFLEENDGKEISYG